MLDFFPNFTATHSAHEPLKRIEFFFRNRYWNVFGGAMVVLAAGLAACYFAVFRLDVLEDPGWGSGFLLLAGVTAFFVAYAQLANARSPRYFKTYVAFKPSGIYTNHTAYADQMLFLPRESLQTVTLAEQNGTVTVYVNGNSKPLCEIGLYETEYVAMPAVLISFIAALWLVRLPTATTVGGKRVVRLRPNPTPAPPTKAAARAAAVPPPPAVASSTEPTSFKQGLAQRVAQRFATCHYLRANAHPDGWVRVFTLGALNDAAFSIHPATGELYRSRSLRSDVKVTKGSGFDLKATVKQRYVKYTGDVLAVNFRISTSAADHKLLGFHLKVKDGGTNQRVNLMHDLRVIEAVVRDYCL